MQPVNFKRYRFSRLTIKSRLYTHLEINELEHGPVKIVKLQSAMPPPAPLASLAERRQIEDRPKVLAGVAPDQSARSLDRYTRRLDVERDEARDDGAQVPKHPDMYDCGEAKYDFIEFVVRTGYKDEPKVGEDGKPLLHRTTALHHAARRGRFHAPMVPLLFNIFNRFDVNYIDDVGISHFMFACMHNCVEAVEKFLELGQDPNCHGKGKDLSPLVYALGNRSKDMVRLLLKYGANPNLSNCTAAMTPLHRLSFRLLDNELLDDSIMNVHIDLVEMIFDDCQDKYKPVNVEARNKFGDTALHFALKENMRKVVEVLLRRGADPNVADSYGSTALHIICKKKDGDVWAKMLFQVCDEVSRIVQVDARDNEGRTPLQLAVANFKPDSIIGPKCLKSPKTAIFRPFFARISTHIVVYIALHCCRSHGDNNFRAILTGSKSITFVPEFEDEKLNRLAHDVHSSVWHICFCTIGPVSRSVEMLEKTIEIGMNISRMNFSHGSHEHHAEIIANVKMQEFCPVCMKNGIQTQIKCYQQDLEEAIFMCPTVEVDAHLHGAHLATRATATGSQIRPHDGELRQAPLRVRWYGGLDPAQLHCYDLDTQTWHVIAPSADSEVPSGRLFHAAAVIGDAMFIFGGTVDNNVRSGETYRFQFSAYPKCTLHDDFGRLLNSRLFCDVEFVVGGSSSSSSSSGDKEQQPKEETKIPAHIAMVAARSKFLRQRISRAIERRKERLEELHGTANLPAKEVPILQVRLQDAVPEAFEMVLNYIYTDRIDPTKKIEDPLSNRIVLLMMDVYRLAVQFNMRRLEQLCVHYLEATISHANVLEALRNADCLKQQLAFIKELCLSFVVRDGNYNQIVMSSEFESLDRPLMVEIIRRKQSASASSGSTGGGGGAGGGAGGGCTSSSGNKHHHHQLNNYERDTGTTLEQDMEHFLNSIGREFCDITLMLDKEPIPAHKAVLTARCSYFEGLFRSFMPPNNTVNIQIGEMIPSAASFRSLLRYIYYADVSMPPEDSLYLFTVPVFYGFTNNRLQAFCKQNLEMNVTIENVIQILEAADKMQAHDIKNYALSLIVHHIGKVVRLPRLKQLDRGLLLDILEAVADERGEARTCQDMTSGGADC
ncbi:unnamed protein product [Trichogramma brassicae]|uniref:BTB domain-containing protein n=1 Tax=Trichogramma brassicae TaxID=86971 RepID=A0A6H5J2G8_9HYME|nr:unnamed protein product [Trichogramma brassicae]